MDLLKDKYPVISRMYNDYLQSDEYAKHPVQTGNSERVYAAIDEAIQYATNTDKNRAVDVILTAATGCEQTGFILGFAYALNLIKEAEVLKELVQCQS